MNCADTAVNLKNQLNNIDKFCTETDMVVKLKKSELIVFRNGSTLIENERWVYRAEYQHKNI